MPTVNANDNVLIRLFDAANVGEYKGVTAESDKVPAAKMNRSITRALRCYEKCGREGDKSKGEKGGEHGWQQSSVVQSLATA